MTYIGIDTIIKIFLASNFDFFNPFASLSHISGFFFIQKFIPEIINSVFSLYLMRDVSLLNKQLGRPSMQFHCSTLFMITLGKKSSLGISGIDSEFFNKK